MVMLNEEELLAALERVFSAPEPPTAIHATFDSMAEMLVLLLPRLGLRVPEDVSLLGFGGAWREGALTRRLSSVVVDEVATGRQAAFLLHEMRCGLRPLDDNTEFVMEASLYEGETLAPPGKGMTRVVRGTRPTNEQEHAMQEHNGTRSSYVTIHQQPGERP